MKKIICLALAALLMLSCFAGCGAVRGNEIAPASSDPEENVLYAAVLYDGTSDGAWEDTLSRMEQPLLLCFDAEAVDVSRDFSLDGYALVYPDESIMTAGNAGAVRDAIEAFAENGGSVFLTNGFYDFFGRDFIGVKNFEKLEAYPEELSYPDIGGDLGELQTIVSDFDTLFRSYNEFADLQTGDWGWAGTASGATALVKSGKLALYTMNACGEGRVFFASAILPNAYSVAGTALVGRDDRQTSLADTTMGATRLLENAFASYAAKQIWGYSVWRVFGSFGEPAMTWELHYEEITGFENGSGIDFGELCKTYAQVPSYTLVRDTYQWFLRAESVTALLGGSDGDLSFAMDYNESAYSSGTHVAADGRWLSLSEITDGGSYFVDYPEYDERACPFLADPDGDGDADILCGSADGLFHYYAGEGYTDRLVTAAGVLLTDAAGNALSVGGYSAPVLCEVDGDGVPDLLSGAADGGIYWFSGNGDLTFTPRGLLVSTGLTGQSLPDAGDLNGDGYTDLVVGSNEGKLLVWYGTADGFAQAQRQDIPVFGVSGAWLAPRIADLDGDGIMDLALGTFDGYVARLLSDGAGNFASGGFIELDEMNYKGNYNAKFGNNCVPFFWDINGDGKTDLVCGSLEYGMAYPIDSPYFPYRAELRKSIDYMKDNGFYLGVHFYTNEYASPAREEYELSSQLAAMRNVYGAGYGRIGANQHTWYTSVFDIRQSFLSLWKQGILWDSGYTPANNSSNYPQASAQNVISLPFYLTVDGERTILLQNCSTLLYTDEAWTDISAKYGMPVCVYYHCDFTHGDPDTAKANLDLTEAFREKHGYSFVMENQLMLSIAAAYNLDLSVKGASEDGLDVTLAGSGIASDFALYDGNYQASCGARVSLGQAFADKTVATDADVWRRDGNDLYISLNRPVRIWESDAAQTETHITNVNIAARVETTDTGATVQFLDGGMMQVTVSGPASAVSEGWTASQNETGVTFTKYGAATSLVIQFEG